MLLKLSLNESAFVGQKFNRLTVLQAEPLVEGQKTNRLYRCLCDCGALCFYSKKSILDGSAQSCKCLRLEMTAQMGRNRKGKLKARTDGIEIKRTASSNSYQKESLNRRAFQYLSSFANNLKNSQDCPVSIFSLEYPVERKQSASRHISNLFKRKHFFLGRDAHHFVYLSRPDSLTSLLIFQGDHLIYGARYLSLKKLKNEWTQGVATRQRFPNVERAYLYLNSLAAGFDLTLDAPDVKVRAVRVQTDKRSRHANPNSNRM